MVSGQQNTDNTLEQFYDLAQENGANQYLSTINKYRKDYGHMKLKKIMEL
jgi:hypothetical protein